MTTLMVVAGLIAVVGAFLSFLTVVDKGEVVNYPTAPPVSP